MKMIELYQFELSQYSEKVRLILDYKGLAYRNWGNARDLAGGLIPNQWSTESTRS